MATKRLHVAILDDQSEKRNGVLNCLKALDHENCKGSDFGRIVFKTQVVRADELHQTNPSVLRGFDVLIVPGGSAARFAERLGPGGLRNIRSYVEGGGGYVGICAGAFLAVSGFNPSGSLNFIDCKVRTRNPGRTGDNTPGWALGQGLVKVKLTQTGKQLLWDDSRRSHLSSADKEDDGLLSLRYSNGPVFETSSAHCIQVLAHFQEEVSDEYTPRMAGGGAIIASNVGSGRVICLSPHVESTPQTVKYMGASFTQMNEKLKRILQRAVVHASAKTVRLVEQRQARRAAKKAADAPCSEYQRMSNMSNINCVSNSGSKSTTGGRATDKLPTVMRDHYKSRQHRREPPSPSKSEFAGGEQMKLPMIRTHNQRASTDYPSGAPNQAHACRRFY